MAQNTKGWVFLLTVILCSPAHLNAQSTTSAPAGTEASISAPLPEKSKIVGTLLVQTAATANTADYRSSTGLYLGSIGYSIPKSKGTLTASLATGYQYNSYQGAATVSDIPAQLRQGQSGDVIDPRLALIRTKPEEGVFDSISYGVKGTIGGFSYASEMATQAFAIGPHFSFIENLGSLWKPLNRITLEQKVDYRYVHHHYKTQNIGKINNPHSIVLESGFDYSLGSRSGIVLGLSYAYKLSYQNVQKTLFGAGLEGYYNLTDQWALSVGFGNDTTGFATDGQSRELDLLKPQNASAYLNINVKI